MDNKFFLTPFSLCSVLLFHQLQESDKISVDINGWFDNSVLLWGCEYCDCFVHQPCYFHNHQIIICTENIELSDSLRKQYLELGYSEDDLFFVADFYDKTEKRCEESDYLQSVGGVSAFDAACLINDAQLFLLKPNLLMCDYTHGIVRIKKMRRWALLLQQGLITQEMSYDDFGYYGNGWKKKEVLVDANGRKHIFLYTLDIGITDKCSLKCDKCANMMQYFTDPQNYCKTEIIRDFERLLSLVDWIDDIAIIGGEPYVDNDLEEILNDILRLDEIYDKVGIIRIITNGTVVPSDSLCRLMAENNVLVSISNYRDLSRSIFESIDKYNRFGVLHYVIDMPNWRNICQLKEIGKSLDRDGLVKVRHECSTRCRTYGDGRFFMCSFMKSAIRLKAVPYDLCNSVNIYDENAVELLADYLDYSNPAPSACSWCTGDPVVDINDDSLDIPVAEQLRQPKPFYSYEAGY